MVLLATRGDPLDEAITTVAPLDRQLQRTHPCERALLRPTLE